MSQFETSLIKVNTGIERVGKQVAITNKLLSVINKIQKVSELINSGPDEKEAEELKEWAKNKSWKEIYETCPRGSWLLWLFAIANPKDLQAFTLAKGHVANTVRHLMEDERSIKAVDAAIAFGEGKITIDELVAAADDAYAAAYVSTSDAVFAAHCCSDHDSGPPVAIHTAQAVDDKETNQLLTANIVRQYMPIDKWNITD